VKYLAELEGALCIVNPKPKPRMVFEITQAYKIIDFYDDLESAKTAMKTAQES
jgi:anti-anti-sigma regulatory factor